MSAIQLTTMDNSTIGFLNVECDNDEIKIFEYDKHEDVYESESDEDNIRFSPVIKEEESSAQQITSNDRSNNDQYYQNLFPYFISSYYPSNNTLQTFEKMSSLECLSKFSSYPSSVHLSNSNVIMDQTTGVSNSIYSLPSTTSFQHWRTPVFPFEYPKDSFINLNHINRTYSQEHKQKKSHIKKPLNAFMLFMREQRAQVVQECTLRESAAINQILGRKWHELDRNVQQKYYDMARDERMKHMQLYPGWSARDNYGVRKKRANKGKKRDKNQECLNQKKCRARFGLEQQANWCKHCKRKKKCLRYTENESTSMEVSSWSDDNDTDQSDDCDVIPMNEHQIHSDDENK